MVSVSIQNCRPQYLSNVVKVPVGDGLLRRQLSQLVEKKVKLELGREVGQAAVAERLQRAVGDECAHEVHVDDEGVLVGVLVLDGRVWNDVILGAEDLVDPANGLDLEAAVLREFAIPRVVITLGRIDGMIWKVNFKRL